VKSTEEFVKQRLPDFLQKVEKNKIGEDISELNIYEKTLIYYYSIEGYEQLNEDLRDGKDSVYGNYLNQALEKLPNYEEESYRGVSLSPTKIDFYKKVAENDDEIIEPAFFSSSKSMRTAQSYSRGNTVFIIASKTGKEIEQLSFYGSQNPQNEKEVLFKSKSKFKVIRVNDSQNITLISLEEI